MSAIENPHGPWATEQVDLPHVLLDELASSLERGDIRSARDLVDAMRRRLRPPADDIVDLAGFTARERATLALLPDGSLSQKDMARLLGVSHNTLKTHLRSLYLKLGAHSRSEAIERAEEVSAGRAGRIRHLVSVG